MQFIKMQGAAAGGVLHGVWAAPCGVFLNWTARAVHTHTARASKAKRGWEMLLRRAGCVGCVACVGYIKCTRCTNYINYINSVGGAARGLVGEADGAVARFFVSFVSAVGVGAFLGAFVDVFVDALTNAGGHWF